MRDESNQSNGTADNRLQRALRGESLYGDDFSLDEITEWFEDEREGYFNLQYEAQDAEPDEPTVYTYDALAQMHGFNWLSVTEVDCVLGIGSATGAELAPLAKLSKSLTVLEPSDGFKTDTVHGKPVSYIKPNASGLMPFKDSAFDIVVCFSVLHHIPNVSTVVREMMRVVKPGGYVLLREPTHSMGDWRKPRRGLTKRERGIPLTVFRQIIRSIGFEVVHEARCMFSLTSRLGPFLRRPVWSYKLIAKVDALVCQLPIWSSAYHAKNVLQKVRPTGVAYVLRRPPKQVGV